jgi:folate-binding Fe-S cluster repair protein YgfZ
MAERHYVILEDRGLVTVGGPDRTAFLQGIVSNDVTRVAPDRAVWAALLTPQGKYLHDFCHHFALDFLLVKMAEMVKILF